MKNSVANAQRNVECGLLFIYKRKGNPHSSFFVLHSSFFIQNRFFFYEPSVVFYKFVAEAAA